MKKKSLWALIVSLFMIIPTMFVFSACKEKHEHEYLEQWSSDATKHWHDCSGVDCDAKSDEADHVFEENWVEGKAATCEEDGVEHLYCSVCRYFKSRVIQKDTTKHLYQEVYTWNEDNTKCTAQKVCLTNSEHKTEPVEGVVSSQVTKEANCEEEGEIVYTATFEGTDFLQQTKTVKTAVNPENHAGGGALTYEWNADKTTCTAKLVCGRKASHVIATETVTATKAEIKAANCKETGSAKMTATFTNSRFITQEETVTIAIDSTKHDELAPVYSWNEDKTQCTATIRCNRDANHVIATETVTTTNSVTKEANCTEKGERTYVAEFTNAKFSRQTKTEDIATTGIHDYNETGTADTSTHKYKTKCKNCEQTIEYDLYTYEYLETKTFNIIKKDGQLVSTESEVYSIELTDSENNIYSIIYAEAGVPILVTPNSETFVLDDFKASNFGGEPVDYYFVQEETSASKFSVYTKNGKSYADQFSTDDMSVEEPEWTFQDTFAVEVDSENKKFSIMGMVYDIVDSEGHNMLVMGIEGNCICVADMAGMKYDFRDNGKIYALNSSDVVQGSLNYERDATNNKILIVKLSTSGGEDQYFYIYEEGKAVLITEDSSLEIMKKIATYTYTDETNGVLYLFNSTNTCSAYISSDGKDYLLGFSSMTWEETDTEGVKTITLTNGTETKEFIVDSSDETGKTLILKQA